MPTTNRALSQFFLNRLAMESMEDPYSLDPVRVMNLVFQFSNAHRLQHQFRAMYTAALQERFVWPDGSPARALIIAGKLEQLLEAAHLLDQRGVMKSPPPRKFRKCSWPMRLSPRELSRPGQVFRSIFHRLSLPGRKQQLAWCTEAALAEFSLADQMEMPDILTFIRDMEKLIDAAYCFQMLYHLPSDKTRGLSPMP